MKPIQFRGKETMSYNKTEQPTAEGAEEILKKHMNGTTVQEYKEELFIEYNTVLAAMQEFANLHAQRIADKMVSESKKPKGKCEMCGNPNVTSSFYCPNCSWHFNPIP